MPAPQQAKKGRIRQESRPQPSPDLFISRHSHPFSSCIVVWEACNLLAQRSSLPWVHDEEDKLSYNRAFNNDASLKLRLIDDPWFDPPMALQGAHALASIQKLDIRAACLHLIYAAHATALERPWEETFVISSQQIEAYLGLDKRKDLSKPAKLSLIKEIALQPCLIKLYLNTPKQGRIPSCQINRGRLWHLVDLKHHFQMDEQGCKHLVGLTFTIKAGDWAEHFLNKQGCNERKAFYQYSVLPKTLLTTIMSIWQQHEGAARMLLWLLFKTRIGREQRIMVPTLLRVGYGTAKVEQATQSRDERKRLLRTFESDLEVLNHFGLKPVFDPETYPEELQPWWVKLAAIPDDPEAAMEFWAEDGSRQERLTDASPRGKWQRLQQARILTFELPAAWSRPLTPRQHRSSQQTGQKRRQQTDHDPAKMPTGLTSTEISNARKHCGLSQRELAELTGKSQSWIRDVEKGRFQVKPSDQEVLKQVLAIA
jgi:DNA-binding transcriptional regulator YiaG